MIPARVLVPVELFWYGWAAECGGRWMVPILGTAAMGVGVTVLFVSAVFCFLSCHPGFLLSGFSAFGKGGIGLGLRLPAGDWG